MIDVRVEVEFFVGVRVRRGQRRGAALVLGALRAAALCSDEGYVAVMERDLRKERDAVQRRGKVDKGFRVVGRVVVRRGRGQIGH